MQNDIAQGLAGVLYFLLCDDVRCGLNLRIKMMCGQTTPPGGRYFLDPRDQRTFTEDEVDAFDVRQSIDRRLRTVFVGGRQPNLPRSRLVNHGYDTGLCNDSNITKRERHVEIGTYCSDYASTPDLVDKLSRTHPAEHGPTVSARFGYVLQIERPLFADGALSLVSCVVNVTPMCNGLPRLNKYSS